MSFETRIVSAGAQRSRYLAGAALLFALGVLALHFGRVLASGYIAIGFPWELDYGEGIVWEQMRLMLAGRGYGPIDTLPAIVFHYPPVFHMLTAGVSRAADLDPLAAGRLISVASTLLIGLFAGLMATRAVRAESNGPTAATCGLVACFATFSFWPIAFWSPLMRVDMVATALSFAGVLAAMAALRRPFLILVAAFLFVASVFTKQTSVVAPAAVFLTFLLLRPKLAWMLAGSCFALGTAVLAALVVATDGGFLRHVFLYNVNRFEPWRLLVIVRAILAHSFYAAVLVIGVSARLRATLPLYRRSTSIAELRQRLLAKSNDAFFLLLLVYALLAALVMISIGKSGSNVNYMIEWMAVLAILLGIAVHDSVDAAFSGTQPTSNRAFGHPAFLPLLIGIQALNVQPPRDYAEDMEAKRVAELEVLQRLVSSAEDPVISDSMVLLVRSGVAVQWEPAIFAELASTGAWDESDFMERISAGEFAFFVTDGTRGGQLFDSRYNPAVTDAMEAAYPVRKELAGYTLHLRPGANGNESSAIRGSRPDRL